MFDHDDDPYDPGETTFDLTADHVRLLRSGVFCWNGTVYGLRRVAHASEDAALCRALGLDPDDVTPRAVRSLRQVLLGTERALEVVLATGSFEPGRYRLRDPHQRMSWEPDGTRRGGPRDPYE